MLSNMVYPDCSIRPKYHESARLPGIIFRRQAMRNAKDNHRTTEWAIAKVKGASAVAVGMHFKSHGSKPCLMVYWMYYRSIRCC